MGRYYNTNRFEGKFGFGIQSSTDPEIFGMQEEDRTDLQYYLDGTEENKKECKRVIDEQYDFLEIPQEDRIYVLEDGKEIWDLLDKYINKHFREFDKEKDKGTIPYGYSGFENGAVELKEGIELARCRVVLGTRIYTDLIKDGYCSLVAEV